MTIAYTMRKSASSSNLPNQNHTTQIEFDQSKAFMVKSKQMHNHVFQVEKVTMTTLLQHQRVGPWENNFYFPIN